MVSILRWTLPKAALAASLSFLVLSLESVSARDFQQECEAEGGSCCKCLVFQTEPDTTYLCFDVPPGTNPPGAGWKGEQGCDPGFCPDEDDCILGGGT